MDQEQTVSLLKRKTKRSYVGGEIGLLDAIPVLMFDCFMDRGAAMDYLMASSSKLLSTSTQ